MIGQPTIIAGVALALFAGFAGSQVQKQFDESSCAKKVEALRVASVKALNDVVQEKLTLTAERDQAKSEVDKVNATTAAQLTALQAMLADDKVKREEASLRIEAAAKEASRNARTSAERAQAARDLMDKIADRCAGSGLPDDVRRLLDGILDPGAAGAPVVASSMPSAQSRDRP